MQTGKKKQFSFRAVVVNGADGGRAPVGEKKLLQATEVFYPRGVLLVSLIIPRHSAGFVPVCLPHLLSRLFRPLPLSARGGREREAGPRARVSRRIGPALLINN